MNDLERDALTREVRNIVNVKADLLPLARALTTLGMIAPAEMLYELKTALQVIIININTLIEQSGASDE